MRYLADCTACGETVEGGTTCGCGYLHLDKGGQAWTRMLADQEFRRPDPNVLVTAEEPVLESELAPVTPVTPEPPARKGRAKAEPETDLAPTEPPTA